jgi:hypothetical protein
VILWVQDIETEKICDIKPFASKADTFVAPQHLFLIIKAYRKDLVLWSSLCVDPVRRRRVLLAEAFKQVMPSAVMRSVLENGALAPSNCNTQPRQVHIVSGEGARERQPSRGGDGSAVPVQSASAAA